MIYKRAELKDVISNALHVSCGGSLEECGAGEYHDDAADDVIESLVEAGVVSLHDID